MQLSSLYCRAPARPPHALNVYTWTAMRVIYRPGTAENRISSLYMREMGGVVAQYVGR